VRGPELDYVVFYEKPSFPCGQRLFLLSVPGSCHSHSRWCGRVGDCDHGSREGHRDQNP